MTWTVGRRILAGYALILGLVALVAGVGYVTLQRTPERFAQLVQRQAALLSIYMRARGASRDAERALLDYILTGDPRQITLRRQQIDSTAAAIAELKGQPGLPGARVDALAAQFNEWRRLTDEVVAVGERGGPAEARKVRDQRVPSAIFERFRDSLDAQVLTAREAIGGLARQLREAADRSRGALLVAALAALGVGVLASVLLHRAVSRPLQETTGVLASSAAEILAATSQQASGASQSSAAVSETVATVDQVAKTAEQAAQRARAVADTAQRAVEIGRAGRKAVEDSTAAMAAVREQVESIAEAIVALAEQAQAIGEIIATVNDIAEQTNLLAINAAVEAARAGDQGRGFAVVAGEVKSLAEQSKKATVQVRQILGEIQRATGAAVMTTEQGSKQVALTAKQVVEAGQTIQSLGEAISEAAQAAAQIVASAGQQAIGMSQIRQAMASIHDAAQQTLASTRQTERAAQDLNTLGARLIELVGGNHRLQPAARG